MNTRFRGLVAFALCLAACSPLGAPVASAAPLPVATEDGSSPAAASAPTTSVLPLTVVPAAVSSAPNASAIVPGSVNRTSLNLSATYGVTASIAVATGVIRVATNISFRNDSGGGIDRVELNTAAARLGGLVITAATVQGQPVTVTVSDQTLIVPLGGILPNGASGQMRIAYRATLRTGLSGSNWMFTRYGGTLALYRWIPWVSAARPFDRPNHGDPFVTPSSPAVGLNITTDRSMVLAAPGAAIPSAAARSWTFQVQNVRDVSIVLAPNFTVTRKTAGGVPIVAYSRPGGVTGATLADLAGRALLASSSRAGVSYPWPAYTVVETAGGYGLESPSMIWIPGNTASASLKYLIYHETAHQWFYGLVGNDQQRQPFADEAAADLLARTVLGTLRASRCATATLDRAITSYSAACYYEKIYIQGGNVLNEIRAKMGTTRFWAAITGYLRANRFGLAGSRQLLETLRLASPVDIMPILRARFPSLY